MTTTNKITLGLLFILAVNVSLAQSVNDLMKAASDNVDKGNLKDAISDYDKILKINPGFSNAIVMKGLCYAQLNQTDSACSCFVDGIEMGSQQSQNIYPEYCDNYKPKLKTDKFKTGTFKYLSNKTDTSAYFTRDKKFQIEYFENSRYKCKFEIKWKSETYLELAFVETNDPNLSFLKKGDVLKVKILKVTGDSFVYYADLYGQTSFGSQQKIKD